MIEDSAHTRESTMATLNFFKDRLLPGEYLIIEDGVLDDLGMKARFRGGPNDAIAAFFHDHPNVYRVDRDCCDFFGPNATYCPNGFLCKI